MSKIYDFLLAEAKWIKAGRPVREQGDIFFLHNICSQCPFFNKGGGWLPGYDSCNRCGCNIHPSSTTLNKLAMGTTSCPDDPPRWGESNID